MHWLMQGLLRAFPAFAPLASLEELPGLAFWLERLVCPGLVWGLWAEFRVSPPEPVELKEPPGTSQWPQWLGHPKIAWLLVVAGSWARALLLWLRRRPWAAAVVGLLVSRRSEPGLALRKASLGCS